MGIPAYSRELTSVEKIVVSPDYAPNAVGVMRAMGMEVGEAFRKDLDKSVESLLKKVQSGELTSLVLVGDFSLGNIHLSDALKNALSSIFVLGICSDSGNAPLALNASISSAVSVVASLVVPDRGILERSGTYISSKLRAQKLVAQFNAPRSALPLWKIFGEIGNSFGFSANYLTVATDREFQRSLAKDYPEVSSYLPSVLSDNGQSISR